MFKHIYNISPTCISGFNRLSFSRNLCLFLMMWWLNMKFKIQSLISQYKNFIYEMIYDVVQLWKIHYLIANCNLSCFELSRTLLYSINSLHFQDVIHGVYGPLLNVGNKLKASSCLFYCPTIIMEMYICVVSVYGMFKENL